MTFFVSTKISSIQCIGAMARNASGNKQGSKNGRDKERTRGPTSNSQALRTRSMEDILCIEALDFGLGIGQSMTPQSSLNEIRVQSEIKHTFNEWLQSVHRSANHVRTQYVRGNASERGTISAPIFQQVDDVVNVDKERDSDQLIPDEIEKEVINPPIQLEPVTIELDDIQEEIDFWSSSLICYVLGANPPSHVMEGYVRRIWRNHKVDKVAMVKRGMFLVRFQTMDARDQVLVGHFFFDKKPLIMKP